MEYERGRESRIEHLEETVETIKESESEEREKLESEIEHWNSKCEKKMNE